jgi:hypothetical protein
MKMEIRRLFPGDDAFVTPVAEGAFDEPVRWRLAEAEMTADLPPSCGEMFGRTEGALSHRR